MSRKARNNYVGAALEVFDELGVTTLSTRNLVKAAIERGLVTEEVKWVYNHMSRKIRDSELFDTSQRGQVSLQLPPGFEIAEALDQTVETEETCGEAPVDSVPEEAPEPEAVTPYPEAESQGGGFALHGGEEEVVIDETFGDDGTVV